MREPGDMSGVARVTFPDQSGIYVVSFIRPEGKNFNVIGEISIILPNRETIGTTRDINESENYSPRFIQSIRKQQAFVTLQDTTKSVDYDSESTLKVKKLM